MWQHYLGDPDTRGDVSAYAAPGRAEDLSGLPPAYVLTAELDPLRDEGIEYATRLMAAGVPTELHTVAGACHGFDIIAAGATLGQRAIDEQVRALAEGRYHHRVTGDRPAGAGPPVTRPSSRARQALEQRP